MKIHKKIIEEKVSVIKFTEEEVESLKLKPNWNYSITEENGKLLLTPYSTVEIDFGQFDKKLLIWLINKSLEEDVSMNEVFSEIIEWSLSNSKLEDEPPHDNE